MKVERYGHGPRTFFAFHGWGGDHRDFAPLAARLPDDASMFSADLPGYGESPKPAQWKLEEILREITAAVETHATTTVTLIGFCSGAVLALLVAQRLTARVERVVMIDPFAFVPWYFRIFLTGWFGRRIYRTTFATPLGRKITSRILQRKQATDDDFMSAFGRVDHEVTLRWLELLHRIGQVDQFAGLALPVDIAYGERTFAAVRESIREYRRVLPQARSFELCHAGHLPLVRAARQLASIIFESAGAAAAAASASPRPCA